MTEREKQSEVDNLIGVRLLFENAMVAGNGAIFEADIVCRGAP